MIRKMLGAEDGQAAVELALVAPLLLLVVLGAVGLAEAGQKRAVVARAAMYGSRLAVVDPADVIRREVRQMAADLDPTVEPERLRVRVSQGNWPRWLQAFANPVTVTVSYKVPLFQGFGWSPRLTVEQAYTSDKWNNGIIADFPAD